jgi:acyl dehydratase
MASMSVSVAGPDRPERELARAPSTLPMLVRAGAGLIPGASRLPFVGGGGGEVPATLVSLNDVAVDRTRLAAYDRLCGFDVSDALPPTYPHVLAFGLQMGLITDGRFPLPAIGLVHITNRIVVHRGIGAGERLSFRVWATPIEPHPRGRQFTLHTEARVGEELVWQEESTNLRREKAPAESQTPRERTTAELAPTGTWILPGDLGRRYGRVSGDLNPIHLHPATARLFGFHGAIVHGMWTQARCLAALGPELPDAYAVEVAFKRPILLPARVSFADARDGQAIVFTVRDSERETPHLEGRVTRASEP